MNGGFTSKDFGANRFYHPSFPNQKEKTRVYYFKTSAKYRNSNRSFFVNPRLFWRRHSDDFLLDYTRPDWYHNRHKTNIFGVEILNQFFHKYGKTSFQTEWSLNQIQSNSLGDHQRRQFGLSIEHLITVKSFLFVFGGTFYNYSDWGWQFCPGLDVSYQFSPMLTFYASTGRAFRPPSFTELYYYSAANHGNPSLKPEKTVDYELGSRLQTRNLFLTFSVFQRKGNQLIDWIWDSNGEFWQATNFSNIATSGGEFEIRILAPFSMIKDLRLGYTYLNSRKSAHGQISKYVLNYLRHQLILRIRHNLILPEISAAWNFRYEDRVNSGDHLLTDIDLQWKTKSLIWFANVANLFNRHYEDFTAVPQPGRWFKLGFRYRIF